MKNSNAFDYKNLTEELWNAITHGIGLIISIPTCIALILIAVNSGNALQITSYSIFGASLVLLFLMSTLLHSMPEKYKKLFSIFDHSSIYILIAGTYTPFLLLVIKGTLGIVLLSIVWGIAIFGIVFKCLFIHKFEAFSLFLYIVMGWLIIFAIKPLYEYLHFTGFTILFLGGLLFTFGSIFYAWRKIPFNHAIWHLFVIAGCACMVTCVIVFI
ncbi:hemolysin D [Ureibacillus massiliensis 4400831 = CIP 108448 = CCUG 49529]|uniref:Hemolysin D n=1 Tax=Ureibacillus massiliensis 4400831 = CIP 108448 = CCUG 49529 TaxID=1211035 RepID=A0A0A3J2Y4_9BACL|nr:hemolysin III family protein [Ureibacillus massiliensis]KGR89553.1 hemolysin D [Ureibacillus massiliensis 4400831 = CIP 108448 = CCUG 49529]